MSNERGMAFALTLMILFALMSLTLGLLSLAAFEPTISRNLIDATQARFAAEAGIEWTFNELAGATEWNTLLAGADPTQGVVLVSDGAIGNLPPTRGVYTVLLRNDTLSGDPAITGVTPPDANPANDENWVVIVTSTGAVGPATKRVRVAVKRLVFPPGLFPAALNFPGSEAEAIFAGSGFEVDGHGWRTNGSLDPGCESVYGVTVSPTLPVTTPGGNEAVVEAALTGPQKARVRGKAQDASAPGVGDNTIAANPVLTPAYIKTYIDKARSAADITLESRGPGGLSLSGIGSSCASDINSPTCWGTADQPKIVHIKGDHDPTSMFAALSLSNNTEGHGILIIEDGDLRVSGNFAWHGPIIITGKYTGAAFLGGGMQTVYGAVIANETEADAGFREGVISGSVQIRYSCEALASSLKARGLTSVANWRDLRPED